MAAAHADRTVILVNQRLLAAVRALLLRFGSVGNILFERTGHTVFPSIDTLGVQVQRLDQRHHVQNRHSVAQHARNQLCIVPEFLVEQAGNTADGIRIAILVGVLEIVTLVAVGILLGDGIVLYATQPERKRRADVGEDVDGRSRIKRKFYLRIVTVGTIGVAALLAVGVVQEVRSTRREGQFEFGEESETPLGICLLYTSPSPRD